MGNKKRQWKRSICKALSGILIGSMMFTLCGSALAEAGQGDTSSSGQQNRTVRGLLNAAGVLIKEVDWGGIYEKAVAFLDASLRLPEAYPKPYPSAESFEAADIEEPVTLTVFFQGGSRVYDDSDVLEKINEYLGEKLNVTLNIIWGTWTGFDDQSIVSINGGDNVDIYYTCGWTRNEYNSLARRGAWVRLDSPDNNLLSQYGTDMYGLLPDILWEGATISGAEGTGIYAVPNYRAQCRGYYWDVNVTLLEKYGYTIEDIRNTDYYGFGEIMEKVKAGEGEDFYPLMVDPDSLENGVNGSVVIVSYFYNVSQLLTYYLNPTDVSEEGIYGNTIVNRFGTEEYKRFIEQSREYYLAGYIDPAMREQETAYQTILKRQMKGEYLISLQIYYEEGMEEELSSLYGVEVALVPCSGPYVDTETVQGSMLAVSTASRNPERAVMFLNLLNTDPYLMNLLTYGVEGTHYNYVDGMVERTEKGLESYAPWNGSLGNETLLYPMLGRAPDYYEHKKKYFEAAKGIPILGWTYDDTDWDYDIKKLALIVTEYKRDLSLGAVDPAKVLPELLKVLEDNGISRLVEDANEQLEEYLRITDRIRSFSEAR